MTQLPKLNLTKEKLECFKIPFVILFIAFIFQFPNLLKAHSNNQSEKTLLSFELKNDFILLELKVNGNAGTFLLDSGAPGLVLNNKSRYTENPKPAKLVGIGGQIEASIVKNTLVEIGHLNLTIPAAHIIDLTHLEEAVDRPLAGLIGLDVFKGYAIRIDYRLQEFEFSKKEFDYQETEGFELAVQQVEHLKVVKINNGEQKLKMILDTGSKSNLIDHKLISQWPASVRKLSKIELIGADQRLQICDKILLKDFRLANDDCLDLIFIASSFAAIDKHIGIKVDGILGQDFLKNYVVYFSKNQKKLNLFPIEKIVAKPFAVKPLQSARFSLSEIK